MIKKAKHFKLIFIISVLVAASAFFVVITTSISQTYTVEKIKPKHDLIEEIKTKYNLDPVNNPKHQCDLMYELTNYLIAFSCKDYNVCYNSISLYHHDKSKKNIFMDTYNQVILYQKYPYKILGIYGYRTLGFDEEYYSYNDYRKSRDNFEKQSYIYSNVNANKSSNVVKLLVNNSHIHHLNTSYLRIRGCYVEDYYIADKDKKYFTY